MLIFKINQQYKSYAQIPRAPQSTRNKDAANIEMPQVTANYSTMDPGTVEMGEGGDQDDDAYDTEKGLGLHFDFISNLERQHRDVRFIYGVYNFTKEIVKNREVGIMQSEPDPSNMARNRVNFDKKHILKHIKPHAGHNLIMEFQVRRTDVAPGEVKYASIGWSVINLFNSNYDLNIGQFKVPLYKTPTQPEIDVRDISKCHKLPKVVF